MSDPPVGGWGGPLKECLNAGFAKEDLIPVSFSLSAANKSYMENVGAILVRLDGTKFSCAAMVYISPSADEFFLSLEAMC